MKNTLPKKIFAFGLLTLVVTFSIGIIVSAPLVVMAETVVIPSATTDTSKKTPCVSSKEEYCLLEPIVVGGVDVKKVNIADYVKTMFKIGIGLAGLFAVFMIIIGGFQYMSTDAVSGKSEGKEKIEGALWGLGLALGSFLILNTINPQLLEFSGGLKPIVVVKKTEKNGGIYKDSSLQELIRIGEQARENRASIEALRTRAQTLKDMADIAESEGKSAEATRLRIEAGKATYEETKLYNSSLIKDKYDMAAHSTLSGGSEKVRYVVEMKGYFAKQLELLEGANAPQKEINTLIAKERRLDQQIKEAEQMVLFKKELLSKKQSKVNFLDGPQKALDSAFDDYYNPVDIQRAIKIMYDSNSETKKIVSELATIDTNEAQILKEFTKNNLKSLNEIIEYRKTCPNDFVYVDGKSLGEEIFSGTTQGLILGAVTGTIVGGQTIVGGASGYLAGGAIAATAAVSSRIGAAMGGQKILCVAN